MDTTLPSVSNCVFSSLVFFNCCSLLYFFCLDTKKVTKKSQASNEYSPLLACSFVQLLCMVVSALVILLLDLLRLKYKLLPGET
jgi:hypothetical protein